MDKHGYLSQVHLDIGQLNWCLKDIYPVKAELCDICCLSVILSAISHECVYGCWPKYGRCEQRDDLLEANKFWCWSGSRCRSRISLSLSLTLGVGYFYHISSLTRERHCSGLGGVFTVWAQLVVNVFCSMKTIFLPVLLSTCVFIACIIACSFTKNSLVYSTGVTVYSHKDSQHDGWKVRDSPIKVVRLSIPVKVISV